MSWVANLMVQADGEDHNVINAFSQWLETDAPRQHGGTGVGSLKSLTRLPASEAWGGWKYPECELWAGALNHAILPSVIGYIEQAPWKYPARVQIFLMDQEETYFRIYMFRDGQWHQYAPPPPHDADDQHAW